MTDDALRTADGLLDAALDLAPAERAAYLDAHAPPTLRAYLRDLVVAAADDDPLLDKAPISVGEVQSAAGVTEAAALGEVVGPYRITGLLGEGGMGRVYRARRADGAFHRAVALKLVRQSLALAGADVSERLRRERGVLASLEHPNIARLYDGGETDDGVPWVAMELVDGEPITAYADSRGLGVAARVALAVEMCQAVEHAHRRLVVHRDLKPSNVFVAEDENGQPVVKLLDFGIARLLDVDVEGLTRTGTPLLTPEYAAPEQVRGGEITTATDVWALGVLLYELLTGQRPYRPEAADTGPAGRLLALDRALQERPAAPSDAAPSADRGRPLRGDLDAIVLQALRLEPERRYASAGALADDLARHLGGLPVVARPASGWYLMSAFVRRNRGSVAATAAVVGALVIGLVASLVSLDRERDARAAAEEEVARADAAFEFVVDLFGGGDGAPLGMETPTRDLLAAGDRRAAALGAGREAEQTVAFSALREVYRRLVQDDAARRAAREAYRAARRGHGPGHPYALDAARQYALLLVRDREYDRALHLVEEAADGYRALGADGTVGDLLAEFGNALAVTLPARPDFDAWAATSERVLDEAEPLIRATRDSVALVYLLNGRATLVARDEGHDAAAPLFVEKFQIERAVYKGSFVGLRVMFNYAATLTNMDDYEAAVPVYDSALVTARRMLQPDHPAFTLYLASAGDARLQRGHPGDVETALAWTAEADRPRVGNDRWAAQAAGNHLLALRAAGRWRDLDARAAEVIGSFSAPGDSILQSWARAQQAFAHLGLGDVSRARALADVVAHDSYMETATLGLLIRACIATTERNTDRTRAALDAAQRSVDAAGLPPHALTSRMVRAGPAGGACDGWVPGR